jgi:hypothetical protein
MDRIGPITDHRQDTDGEKAGETKFQQNSGSKTSLIGNAGQLTPR